MGKSTELQQSGTPYYEANTYSHEALQKENPKPKEAISENPFSNESAFDAMENLIKQIEEKGTEPLCSTGIKSLDSILDGGLYPKLYVIGAISSLGKTTLACQIADNIASTGKKVLFFSLEMDKNTLIAKSVSRLSFLLGKEHGFQNYAKTAIEIMNGPSYIVQDAFESYSNLSHNIFIYDENISLKFIKEKTSAFIKVNNETPVVFIDYIQMLAQLDNSLTDKQSIDNVVTSLKMMCKELNVPVIAISSLNRDSYFEPISMKSFKESGTIEYIADVLLGMQYKGMDYTESETEREHLVRIKKLFTGNDIKTQNGFPLQLQLKVLKNRVGSKGNIDLNFIGKFNYFADTQEKENLSDLDRIKRKCN